MKPHPGGGAIWPGEKALLAGLLVVVTLPFLPTLSNDFVMDDHVEIVGNPHVTGSWDRSALLSDTYAGVGRFTSGFYRPVLVIACRLICLPSGPAPLPFHLANLAVHAAAVAFGFLTLRTAGATVLAAGGASLLFGLHPFQVDVVSPASGLKDLLAAAFGFASAASWLDHRRSTKPVGRLALCCLLYLLAVLSKESIAVLPLIFVAADLAMAPQARSRARSYIPVTLTLAVASILRLAATGGLFRVSAIPAVDNPLVEQSALLARLSALRILTRYMSSFFWPARISHDYSADSTPLARTPLEAEVVLGACLLAGTIALSLWLLLAHPPAASSAARPAARSVDRLSDRRLIGFGLLYFLATYLLVSNLVQIFGTNMAPRLFFLPSWGLCVALGGASSWLARSRPHRFNTIIVVLCAAGMALAARTWIRCADWRDDETLFASAVKAAPRNTKMLSNLAVVRIRQGLLDEAEELSRRALAIRADAPRATDHLATVYERKGRRKEAIALLAESVSKGNALPSTRNLLARLLIAEGRLPEAATQIQAVLSHPNLSASEETTALWLRGRIARMRGEARAALGDLERAIALSPADPPVLFERGLARLSLGETRAGLVDLEAAVSAAPDSPDYLFSTGTAWLQAGDPGRAAEYMRRVLALEPDSVRAHVTLGAALVAAGRRNEAREELARALELAPNDPIAHLAMGDLLASEGKESLARSEYRDYLRLASPDDPNRKRVLTRAPGIKGLEGPS